MAEFKSLIGPTGTVAFSTRLGLIILQGKADLQFDNVNVQKENIDWQINRHVIGYRAKITVTILNYQPIDYYNIGTLLEGLNELVTVYPLYDSEKPLMANRGYNCFCDTVNPKHIFPNISVGQEITLSFTGRDVLKSLTQINDFSIVCTDDDEII